MINFFSTMSRCVCEHMSGYVLQGLVPCLVWLGFLITTSQ